MTRHGSAGQDSSRVRIAMRAIAIVIAIAAMIDPVWTATAPALRELIAIDLTTAGAGAVIAELANKGPQWQIVERRVSGTRLPCGADERCVAIADGSIDAEIPTDIEALSVIAVRPPGFPNIAIRSLTLSRAHESAAGAARVELNRSGTFASTDLRILDGGALVGAMTHRWSEGDTAVIDMPWWPIGAGARVLRVDAAPVDGETSIIDNAIDAGVTVAAGRQRALVFDARPSWNSTFVRRAIEDDARFDVEYRARVAPAVSAGTANGALDARVLEATPVVIVGGADALTASDVALLDRYVSRRGGSLILLPEQKPAGPVTRLTGDGWTEQLSSSPQPIGSLRAAEVLRIDRLPLTAVVLARSESAASIVALASGNGRVIISGAMDAWRYRDGTFDRFWRSLVAEAARAGDALQIGAAADLAATGQRIPFTLRHRSLDDRHAIEARVSARCGDGAFTPVRVWPSGPMGELAGEIVAGGPGHCEIEAAAGDRTAAAYVAVADRPHHGVESTLAKLEHASPAAGGATVAAGNEGEILSSLDDSSAESSQVVSIYPMRSAWWIIPFAGCVSLEWWLRRRAGLR